MTLSSLALALALTLAPAALTHAASPSEPMPEPAPAAVPLAPAAVPPVATPEPSVELRERNLALTERMHRGERMMIGGRIGAGASAALLGAPGIALLAVGIAGDRPGLIGAGAAVTAVGVTGVVVSSVFAVRGFREVQAARAGRLSLWGSPSVVGLRWSARF